MHFKNRKPKPFRGCCAMCSRAQRIAGHPSLGLARVETIDAVIASECDIWQTLSERVRDGLFDPEDEWPEDAIDRWMGCYPGTNVQDDAFRVSVRVPVLRRPIVLA